MKVSLIYMWPDESTMDLTLDDEIADYHPTRTAELCDRARDLLDKAILDRTPTITEP